MEPFENRLRRGGTPAIAFASEFVTGDDRIVRALVRVDDVMTRLSLPYAVTGDMAVIAHGYVETTCNVEVLLAREGFVRFREQAARFGYGGDGRRVVDEVTAVAIRFVIAGERGTGGEANPILNPDPAAAAILIDGVRYVRVKSLVEMKLGSGTNASARSYDIADVIGLIRSQDLPMLLARELHESVRAKYKDLWREIEIAKCQPLE